MAAKPEAVRAPLIPFVMHLYSHGHCDGSLQAHPLQHAERDMALAIARVSGPSRGTKHVRVVMVAEGLIPATH
jgi:hypothetical protein